jgi:predicted RNA binding protein YcfA (HicA-like mRNA interferase family)
MSSKEAMKRLIAVGFEFVRRGKGDHLIFQKEGDRIVFSAGKSSLRSGMVRRIEYTLKKHGEVK